MSHKIAILKALEVSFPIAVAYIPMGMVLGLLLENQGYPWSFGAIMNLLNFAGILQLTTFSLMQEGVGWIELSLTGFFMALRNAFYGQAFFERFAKFSTAIRYYLIFGLVDTTYALLLLPPPVCEKDDEKYCFYLVFFMHFYWVFGGLLGGAFGHIMPEIKGLEFILAILFSIFALEQYLKNKRTWTFVVGILGWMLMQWWIPQYAILGSICFCMFIFSFVLLYQSRSISIKEQA